MDEPSSAFYRERAEDLATIAAEAALSNVKEALLDAKEAFLAKADALDAAPSNTPTS